MEEHHLQFSPTRQQQPLSSTLPRSSSFIDDCRDARDTATKEFDQFYGYIAKALTPRRTQQRDYTKSDKTKIQKGTAKNTTRIRRDLSQRHNTQSTSLTPMMEQHSLMTENKALQSGYQFQKAENHYISSPSSSRHRQQNYPPPRPMTLSPNTTRDCSRDSLSFEQESELENEDLVDLPADVYLPSPQRTSTTLSSSTTPVRLSQYSSPIKKNSYSSPYDMSNTCPPSPSIILRDKLVDESRRLEQLQHNILLVQQQSFVLTGANPSSLTATRKKTRLLFADELQKEDPFTVSPFQANDRPSSIQSSKKKQHSTYHPTPTSKYSSKSNQRPSSIPTPPPPPPIFTTSTPLGSPETTHQSLHREHPVFLTKPTGSLSPKSHVSLIPSSSITKHPSGLIPSSSPIPNLKLLHNNSSPRQQQGLNDVLNDIPKARLRSSKIITTPNGSRLKNRFWEEIHEVEKDPLKNEIDQDAFWMAGDNQHSKLTSRLKHVKTLDQELGLANDKHAQLKHQQKQEQLKSKIFSLRPRPDEEDQRQGVIDGDQWTFAGQHYTVHEKA